MKRFRVRRQVCQLVQVGLSVDKHAFLTNDYFKPFTKCFTGHVGSHHGHLGLSFEKVIFIAGARSKRIFPGEIGEGGFVKTDRDKATVVAIHLPQYYHLTIK